MSAYQSQVYFILCGYLYIYMYMFNLQIWKALQCVTFTTFIYIIIYRSYTFVVQLLDYDRNFPNKIIL